MLLSCDLPPGGDWGGGGGRGEGIEGWENMGLLVGRGWRGRRGKGLLCVSELSV